MVVTDLLLGSIPSNDPEKAASVRKILNILADRETTVTPWLADRLGHGDLSIRWLTAAGVVGRFLKSFFVSRNVLEVEESTGLLDDS